MNRTTRQRACQHLRKSDPVLRAVIDAVGPFTLKFDRDRFGMLVRSIIAQQISGAAARTIRGRVEQLVAPEKIAPENLRRLTETQLRSAGLSSQKLSYIQDLAAKTADGVIDLRNIGRRDDEQVIAELTQVKGIGRWTAQMFMMFSLGRPDVFPEDDLGVRSAIRTLYSLPDLPDRATSRAIAEPWRPFASVASWYCWRSLDQAKEKK